MKRISLATLILSFIMGQAAFAASSTDTSTTASSPTTTSNGAGCPDRMKKMFDTLNLDDSQRTKIKAIKDQLKEDQKANMEQMKSLRTQIHALIQSDTLDNSKLNSLIDQKKELLGQMMKAKITAKQQVWTLLTDQQKSQFKQMMQQMEQQRKMKHRNC